MSLPKLKFNSLILREISLEDAAGRYPSWLNDPIVTKYNSHGLKEYTREMAIEYIKSVNASLVDHVFAIEYDGEHIGNVSLQNINPQNASAEFAILIGETSAYGKGIGYQVGTLIIEYGFNDLNLHRIYCGTTNKNVGMQKLALKLGMQEEGRRKDAFYKNEQYFDIIEFGIVNKKA